MKQKSGMLAETTINDIYNLKASLEPQIKKKNSRLANTCVDIIESVCIFTLIWTIGISFKPLYRPKFSNFLIICAKNYYGTVTNEGRNLINSPTFLRYFEQSIKQDKTIFDVCYDINNQCWSHWAQLKIEDYPIITNSLENITFSFQEFIRLNPRILKIINTSKKFSYETRVYNMIPEMGEQFFIHTDTTKKLRYLLDFLIPYKRPISVVSEHDNGKSVVIKHKLKQLLESGMYIYLCVPITKYQTQDGVIFRS